MITFVFWHPYLVFHLAPYIRELSLIPGFEVIVCAQTDLPESYKCRGYPIPDHGRAKIHIAPSTTQIESILSIDNSHQVFFGLRAFPLVKAAYQISKRHNTRRYLMTENRNEAGIRSFPRRLIYTLDAHRESPHLDGIFCIGATGPNGGLKFLESVGFPKEKIFPFRYVIEPFAGLKTLQNPNRLSLIFVGQLIYRKGLDTLLKAIARARNNTLHLRIIGSGANEHSLKKLANALQISNRVTWLGNLKNETVREEIASASILVLPSRFDGWGAVVNESLACGTPVICSDRCGSQELIKEGINGFKFKAGDVDDLSSKLAYYSTISSEFNREEIILESQTHGPIATAKLFLKNVLMASKYHMGFDTKNLNLLQENAQNS